MNHLATKDGVTTVQKIGNKFGAEEAGMPIRRDPSH